MSNYQLNRKIEKKRLSLKNFWPLIKGELWFLVLVLLIVLANSVINVSVPYLIGLTVDQAIGHQNGALLLQMVLLLMGLFLVGLLTIYLQTSLMGRLSQRILYNLRTRLFDKIQELPLIFFNVNKTGDLISRINNDTDKLNQFFSEALVRFVGNAFTILGIGVFIFFLNFDMAVVALSVSCFLALFTQFVSPWLRSRNEASLRSLGQFSGEIQEDLNNFKAIVAFNQGEYFYNKFNEFNSDYFKKARKAAFANSFLAPIYDLASNSASILVLLVGVLVVANGQITIGLLISFMAYTDKFYQPLRILASIWATIQTSLAAWGRVDQILCLKSDLKAEESHSRGHKDLVMEFRDVGFEYVAGKPVLEDVSLRLEYGKSYALIGPTGGGKSTMASLMARLYDVSRGEIFLHGKSLCSYSPEEISGQIGFILQEPIIFSGTLLENVLYGNKKLESYTEDQLEKALRDKGMMKILDRFPDGLKTKISNQSESISLGQKQLIAFLRIFLREPALLIMDEATANIDTVTEQYLTEILDNLPATTTRVIIAHRLNTIKDVDEIVFISGGRTQKAVGYEEALALIEANKLNS